MKGKKLIACIISALLIAGLLTPVYAAELDTAAETVVGAANVAGLVEGDKTRDELRDESLAALAEAEKIQNEGNEENTGAETDAVPENVESATGAESAVVSEAETADSSVSAGSLSSDESTDSSAKTESKTDSLTDSSLSDQSKEQEVLVGAKYTSAVPVDGKTYMLVSRLKPNSYEQELLRYGQCEFCIQRGKHDYFKAHQQPEAEIHVPQTVRRNICVHQSSQRQSYPYRGKYCQELCEPLAVRIQRCEIGTLEAH